MNLNLDKNTPSTLPKDPLDLFSLWYSEFREKKSKEPTAMVLATSNTEGKPSARTVLLKSYDQNGFVFFTNYDSQKGHDLKSNPWAQLLFYWEPLARQVRILGAVERTSTEESDRYFASRPYLSQIGAYASEQSKKIKNRETLVERAEELKQKYPEGKVPRPSGWGGFCVKPISFEFWIGRENRLHDRFLYEKQSGIWQISRLAP